MKLLLATCTATALLITAAGTHAQTRVTGDIGTTGIGFHASVPLSRHLAARVGMGYLDYSYHGSAGSFDYDLGLKTKTYDALLDWYPNENSAFRMTAGLAYNGNRIDVAARPNAAGNYTVQGNTYDATSAGKVTGQVTFGKVAPYLGIGWGKSTNDDKGWSVSTDVGVMLQGSPKTTLASSGCSAGATVCNQLASDVAKENVALSQEVHRFRVYPVLRVGLSYKF